MRRASCLEKNLNLVLQALEITQRAVVCVNLMDEAKKKKIRVDLDRLSQCLGVPVVGASARSGKGITELMDRVNEVCVCEPPEAAAVTYPEPIVHAIGIIAPCLCGLIGESKINLQWAALKLLDGDEALLNSLETHIGVSLSENEGLTKKFREAREYLNEEGITPEVLKDMTVSSVVLKSEEIYRECICAEAETCHERDRRLDRIFTGKLTGIPVMLLLLLVIFWLTITGANYPSQLISDGLFWL